MKVGKRFFVLSFLLVLSLLLHIFSSYTNLVETYYSNGFYKHYSAVLRAMTGWIPFSLGDLLYGGFFVWIIWKLIRRLRGRRKAKASPNNGQRGDLVYKILVMLCLMYLVFNISWGINYNRSGIATQLGLKMQNYSVTELHKLNCLLVEKVVASKQILTRQKSVYPQNTQLFKKVSEAYKQAGKQYTFITYSPPSMKSSLWGWLGNYTGFTGYYNPFTGEAQVNTTVPKFLQPFVACHEGAHQAGYAKEQEANFVGYLAASVSPDTLFHYSVYLDLFVYANRNLYRTDSSAAKLYVKDLGLSVLKDLKEWKEFNRRHKSPLEPVFRTVYGVFLRSNQQPEGLLSYDEVTGFMIAYYKKFGRI